MGKSPDYIDIGKFAKTVLVYTFYLLNRLNFLVHTFYLLNRLNFLVHTFHSLNRLNRHVTLPSPVL